MAYYYHFATIDCSDPLPELPTPSEAIGGINFSSQALRYYTMFTGLYVFTSCK